MTLPILSLLEASVVQDNTQKRTVDMDPTVVLDQAQSSEFVHKKIDPGSRRANHLRQHFLRNFGKHLLRMAWLAIAGQEQQSAGQPFFAGVEKLIDQVLFDPNVSS